MDRTLLVRVSVCHTGFIKTGISIMVYTKVEQNRKNTVKDISGYLYACS